MRSRASTAGTVQHSGPRPMVSVVGGARAGPGAGEYEDDSEGGAEALFEAERRERRKRDLEGVSACSRCVGVWFDRPAIAVSCLTLSLIHI